MKIINQRKIEGRQCNTSAGEFNGGDHLFLELTPKENQTISVKLPSGKHVTFAFVPDNDDPNGFECVDIHSNVGQHWRDEQTLGRDHYKHLAIGFHKGGNTFDTRRGKLPTGLITLLLADRHHTT